MNLNIYYKETYERYFNRYYRVIRNRILNSIDLLDTFYVLLEYFGDKKDALTDQTNLGYQFECVDEIYKVGIPFAAALKSLKENKFTKNEKKGKLFKLDNYSDKEFTRLYAEYKTYDEITLKLECNDEKYFTHVKFNKELLSGINDKRIEKSDILNAITNSNNIPKSATNQLETDELDFDVSKSINHTTSRQILALHFMFKYMQVTNVDKTEVARFFQFITGKSFDNIYKRVRDPYRENNKTLKSDLKYIREYFNKLEMLEIVKMINNEIAECDAKK